MDGYRHPPTATTPNIRPARIAVDHTPATRLPTRHSPRGPPSGPGPLTGGSPAGHCTLAGLPHPGVTAARAGLRGGVRPPGLNPYSAPRPDARSPPGGAPRGTQRRTTTAHRNRATPPPGRRRRPGPKGGRLRRPPQVAAHSRHSPPGWRPQAVGDAPSGRPRRPEAPAAGIGVHPRSQAPGRDRPNRSISARCFGLRVEGGRRGRRRSSTSAITTHGKRERFLTRSWVVVVLVRES